MKPTISLLRVVTMVVLCAFVAGSLNGCAGLGDIEQEPSITVESVRPVQITQERCQILLRMSLKNNSPVTLAYNRVVVKLESLATSRPLLVELHSDLFVPGYMARSTSLQLWVPSADLRKLLGAGKDRGPVRIAGGLYAGKRSALFFTETELVLPRLPEIRLDLASLDQASVHLKLKNSNSLPLTIVKIEGRVIRAGQVWDFQSAPAAALPASSETTLPLSCAHPAEECESEGDDVYGQVEFQTQDGLHLMQRLSPRMVENKF